MALNDNEIETFLNIPIDSEDEYADGFELSDDEDINEVNNNYKLFIELYYFCNYNFHRKLKLLVKTVLLYALEKMIMMFLHSQNIF